MTLANDLMVASNQTGTVVAAPGQTLTLEGSLSLGSASTLVFGSASDNGIVVAGFGSAGADGSNNLRVAGGTLRVDSGSFGNTLSSLSSTIIDAGATFNLNGQNGGSATIANLQGSGTLTNTATTTVLAGNFAGAITGTGGLMKATSGTLVLSGTNTYSGGTNINNGTLQIGNGGTTGSLGSGNIVLGNALAFNRSDDALTVANAISGSGRVRQIGSGTTTLTGALSQTGITSVEAGKLVLGDALNAVTLPGNATIAAASSLIVANGSLGSGTITNSGTVRFLDHATGGTATYTGNTGSSLDFSSMVAASTTLGSLAGTGTVNLGSAVLSVGGNGTTTTFTGVIADAGAGGLTKVGAGSLILTGDNTYEGVTTVSNGTLQIGGGGLTGALGSGAVINNSRLEFWRSDSVSVANVISGTGDMFKYGSGSLTLTGDSSAYTGSTTAGTGTLFVNGKLGGSATVGSSAALGGAGTIGGNVTVYGTLSAGNSPGTLTISGNLTLDGSSTSLFELNSPGVVGGVGIGGNDLVKVGGALTIDGTLDARVASAGHYRLFDYGTLTPGGAFATKTISSTNVGFTVASHEVRTNTAQQVNLSVLGAGQTLQFWDGSTTSSNGIVEGGSGTWQNFATNWTNDTGTVNGGWAGSVGVFEGTAGTVTVSGALDIDTLQFSTDGYVVQGSPLVFGVAGGGTLNTGTGVSTTIASTLRDGAGSALTKVGGGTLVLSGTNTYSGGTTLLGGVLSVSADSNMGNAAGTLTLDGGVLAATTSFTSARGVSLTQGGFDVAGAHTLELTGVISGSGDLRKLGTGTLVLSGANAYGNTAVEAGTLIGNAGTISGDIGVAAGASAIFDQTTNASFSDNVAGLNGGKGAMVKRGAGTLTLTANSSLDWAITAGGLSSAAERFSGDAAISSGASLTFNQSGSGTYAGLLSGAGSFTKAGSGTATLTGDSTAFTGTTAIAGGLLVVGAGGTGKLGGTIDVLAGGALGGSGTVGTTRLASGSTLAPGNSIGTLTVDGDLVFATGARFAVEVAAGGATSDLVAVTGTATINGGNVAHIGMTGTYDPTQTYTILGAAGGVTGTFDAVTSDFAFLDASLTYDAKAVMLTLARNDTDFAEVAVTRNQIAAAGGLTGLTLGNALYDAVVQLDETTARAAFDQLSGEMHASVRAGLILDSDHLRIAVNDRLRAAFNGVAVWGKAFGSLGSTHSDGNAASTARSTGGMFAGVDAPVADQIRLGLVAGYSQAAIKVGGRASSANIDSYHLGAYGGTQWDMPEGVLALRGGLAYSWHNLETSRTVGFAGFSDSLSASYGAGTIQAFGELGYAFETEVARFEPFINLAHVAVHSGGFTEAGGAAAMAGHIGSSAATFSTVGVRVETDLDLGIFAGRFDAMVGWRHAVGDIAPQSTHSFAGTDAFTIAGSPIGRDALVLDAGLNFDLTPDATFGLSYQGQFASGAQDHGFKANLAIKF